MQLVNKIKIALLFNNRDMQIFWIAVSYNYPGLPHLSRKNTPKNLMLTLDHDREITERLFEKISAG